MWPVSPPPIMSKMLVISVDMLQIMSFVVPPCSEILVIWLDVWWISVCPRAPKFLSVHLPCCRLCPRAPKLVLLHLTCWKLWTSVWPTHRISCYFIWHVANYELRCAPLHRNSCCFARHVANCEFCRSWSPHPGYQILATWVWLPGPVVQILTTRFWITDFVYQVLEQLPDVGYRSWPPDPG